MILAALLLPFDEPAASREGFPHGQSPGCVIVQLHPQAHMIGNACRRANGGSARRSAGDLP